jgi:hypothetical protein
MKKADARQLIDSLHFPAAQAKAAQRTISRATATDDIEIVRMDSGDLLITRTQPGRIGRQVFEDTIRPHGSKQVVQKAYDADGNLTHFDPKGGTP